MTMSIAGGQTNQYLTNPSYLAGLLSSTMTMSIAGGQTNQYLTNPSYLAGLLSSTMTMSIAGGQTNQYLTNPSYLAGLPSGTMTMSIAGGQTNQHKNLSYFVATVNTISASDYNPAEESCTEEFSNLNYHEDIANASDVLYPLYQRDTYLSATYSCNLRGGMYSSSNDPNLSWSVLENKLALISRAPEVHLVTAFLHL
ncbi:Hypothetical predicted protein [Paramuricea clavata]|uniref:Uncharacterized protein n=1 Tax=Paramuricea clavata TaxID=317549 RepID=A0A7D9D6M1_PARCT|nr:Hypothetical predicted protein [Paramuricea clavata]